MFLNEQTDANGRKIFTAAHQDSDGKPTTRIEGNVQLTGSYVRLSTEAKPTTGVQDGNDLLEVDTGKVFVFYSGSWREI